MNEVELQNLIVRLSGDASSFQKSMVDAQATATQTAQQVEQQTRQVESFGRGLQSFAGSVVQAFAAWGAISFLKNAFSMFTEMETTQLKLKAAIEVNGGAVEATMKQYEEFAAAIKATTGHGKEETINLLRKAESYEITGNAAKKAAAEAIALAAINDGEASSYLRIAAAINQGNVTMAMHMARLVPQLRGVKTEEEFLVKYNKLIAAGTKEAAVVMNSTEGVMRRFHTTVRALTKQFGGLVAEVVKPAIIWLTDLIGVFTRLDNPSKRLVVITALVGAALLTLGPALGVISVVMAPIIAGFGTLVSMFGSLLGPVGLAVIAITGLGYAVLKYTDLGSKAVDWFRSRWADLVEYLTPAITGIKAALASGDLIGAFKIAWAQIKLSFFQAIQPIQEGWIALKLLFVSGWDVAKEAFFVVKDAIVDGWNYIRDAASGAIEWIQDRWAEVNDFLSENFSTASDTVTDLWDKTKAFFGEFKLASIAVAFVNAVALIKSSWFSGVFLLKQSWSEFKDNFQDVVAFIKVKFGDFYNDFKKKIQLIGESIRYTAAQAARPDLLINSRVADRLKREHEKNIAEIESATTSGMADAAAEFAKRHQESAQEMQKNAAELQKTLTEIETKRAQAVAGLTEQGEKELNDLQDRLKDLEAERDALIKDAVDNAAKVPPIKPAKLTIEPPEVPRLNVKVAAKFDAASFNSAEAQARINEFRDRIGLNDLTKSGKVAIAQKFEAAGAGGAEANARLTNQKEQTDILKDIKDGINRLVEKRVPDVGPAEL